MLSFSLFLYLFHRHISVYIMIFFSVPPVLIMKCISKYDITSKMVLIVLVIVFRYWQRTKIMSKHCSGEERLEQNLDRQMLPEKTFSRHANLLLRTKQFQGSCGCLLNTTRLFIISKKSSTKDYLDHHLSPNPKKVIG